MAEMLSDETLRGELDGLTGWTGDTAGISRTVELPDFRRAVAAVDRVADVAEELNHHPDIDIRWRTVTFRCATHSLGGVTQRDLELARRIDDTLRDAA